MTTKRGWRQRVLLEDAARLARRRPPRRFRGRQTAALRALESLLARVPAMMKAQAERRSKFVEDARTRVLRECNYSEAYDTFRRLRLPAQEGPLDISDLNCFDVLVSCVCSRKGDPPWRRLQKTHGHSVLYRIGFALLALRRPGRQKLGMMRLAIGELPWTLRPLKVPRALGPSAVRQVTRAVIAHLARGSPWRARWLRHRLRVVWGPERTF